MDCGYNVFGALKEKYPHLLANLTHVCITHTHDDHIGSLSTLIYYKYFIEPSADKLTVICHEVIKETILPMCQSKLLIVGRLIEEEFAILLTANGYNNTIGSSLKLFPITTNHQVVQSIGYLFIDEEAVIFFSGDTKASASIEEFVVAKLPFNKPIVIFHDYSSWNVPSRNVHACANDIEAEYSQEFQDAMYKVHNYDPDLVGKVILPVEDDKRYIKRK